MVDVISIGEYGNLWVVLLSCVLLYKRSKYMVYYGIGVLVNELLNIVLKSVIRQPRPMFDTIMFNHSYGNLYGNLPYNMYGMPSGHAQIVWFSVVYMYYVVRSWLVTFVYLFVAVLTSCQRIRDRWHTPFQVLVGVLLGGCSGYYFSHQYVKEVYSAKGDDITELFNQLPI